MIKAFAILYLTHPTREESGVVQGVDSGCWPKGYFIPYGIMLSVSHRKDALTYYIENMEKGNVVNTLKNFVIKAVEAYW